MFTIWMPHPVVVITDHKVRRIAHLFCLNISIQLLQEHIVKDGDKFSDRINPKMLVEYLVKGEYGLVFNDNSMWRVSCYSIILHMLIAQAEHFHSRNRSSIVFFWRPFIMISNSQEQRRFALHALRNVGFNNETIQVRNKDTQINRRCHDVFDWYNINKPFSSVQNIAVDYSQEIISQWKQRGANQQPVDLTIGIMVNIGIHSFFMWISKFFRRGWQILSGIKPSGALFLTAIRCSNKSINKWEM